MSAPTATTQLIACAQNRRVVNTLLTRVRFYEHQGDALRARSYIAAANTVSRLATPLRPGRATELPGVGRAIGRAIQDACSGGGDGDAGSVTPRIRASARRGRPRKSTLLPSATAAELARAEAWMRDPSGDPFGDVDKVPSTATLDEASGPNDDGTDPVTAAAVVVDRHATVMESECPEDGIDAAAHRAEFALRTDAVVQLVDAQRLIEKLRRVAAGISSDIRVEGVGAHRRQCLYGRRLHVLVTAAGTVSKEGDHDERHHVLMPKVVRAAQSVGIFGPTTRHVGSRGLVVRTNFDGGVEARERYRREFIDAAVRTKRLTTTTTTTGATTTTDEAEALFDALPLALQDRIMFPQPVFVEWSAHDRFFGRLACLTGPPSFTASLQAAAAAQCMRLTPDEGLVVGSMSSASQAAAAPIACASEADVFRHLKQPYVDPELRGVGTADSLFDDIWR